MKKTITGIATVALAMLLSGLALADNAGQKQIDTALTHARYAAAANDIQTAQLHLHHVVNCLGGSKGKTYDAAAGDPCQGMGHGAINDVAANSSLHAKVKHILWEAEEGLKATKFEAAHKDAAAVEAKLTKISSNAGKMEKGEKEKGAMK